MALALVLAGCAGMRGESKTVPVPSSTSVTTAPVTTPRPTCANPEGGACLNELPAGTFSTTRFRPTLTYRTPAGWTNVEDTVGNFALLPPGFTVDGVNAGTADYIGVYTSIMAVTGCDAALPPGVGTSPVDLRDFYAAQPGLRVSNVADVKLGGRTGVVLDVRLRAGWTTTCEWSNGQPVVDLFLGRAPSDVEHSMLPGATTRLYLLVNDGGTLAIESAVVRDASQLDAYDAIIRDFVFAPY